MFESLSLLTLQQYWWIIVSLLGALLVFLMFVQGGQTLIRTIGKTPEEQTLLINILGRKWELTFTTLVTFGGAFFASFPLFYSTSFGGAYWVWMTILVAFVLQAIAYEYRKKPGNFFGARTFEIFLVINGIVGTVLIGTAVATFFTGSLFSVNKLNMTDLTSGSYPVISVWKGPAHGLEAALDIRNLLLGLAILFLARVLALLYFINRVDHVILIGRARKHLLYNFIPFLGFFLGFVIWLMLTNGFQVDPSSGIVSLKPYKYFLNLTEMPVVASMFLAGVLLVLAGNLRTIFCYEKCRTGGIWLAGIGTILTVWSLLLVAGFNNTAFYPSLYDLQSSLTIENSSSGKYTLTAMSYVSLLVPFVAAYIWYAWRSMEKKKISLEELDQESHLY
jgi:cytochrome d ubiquinol oxidase subunit II